jgi:hypothetical protein
VDPRERRRWPSVAAAILAFAVAGVVLSGCAGSSTPKTSTPKPADNAAAPIGSGVISGTFVTRQGVALRKVSFDQVGKSCTDGDLPPPDSVAESSDSAWCVESYGTLDKPDAIATFKYDIVTPAGAATGYFIQGRSKVPFAGQSEESCTVYNLKQSDPPANAPYTCVATWADPDYRTSYDPKPHWEIKMKPTVVLPLNTPDDRDAVITLLNQYCTAGQSDQCSYTATSQKVTSAPRDEWQLYGQTFSNCSDRNGAPFKLMVSRKLSWSDSLDISVHAEAKVFGVLKAGADVAYSHEVTAEYEIAQTYSVTVEYKHSAGYYIQPGYLEITGDFQLLTPADIKLVKGFTAHLPLGNEYSPPGHPELKFEPAVVRAMDLGIDTACGPGGTLKHPKPGSPPPAGAKDLGPAKPA